MNELERTFAWMREVVCHPGGCEEGLASDRARELAPGAAEAPERMVLPSATLTSIARLRVYADMLTGCMLTCFRGTYPGVACLLGAERFAEAVRQHVQRRPSTTYAIHLYGRDLSDTLEEIFEDPIREPTSVLESTGELPRAFVVELARLESALQDMLYAPQVAPMTVDPLRGLAPEAWLGVRFRFVPAMARMRFEFSVCRYADAVRADAALACIEDGPEWLLASRANWRVQRRTQCEAADALLGLLEEGRSLGEGLELLLERGSVDEAGLMEELGGWFHEWSAARIFAKIEEG